MRSAAPPVHTAKGRSGPDARAVSRSAPPLAHAVLALQRAAGNRALGALIQRQITLTSGEIRPNVTDIGSNFKAVLKALDAYHNKTGSKRKELEKLLARCEAWLTSTARAKALPREKPKRAYIERIMSEASAELAGVSARDATLLKDPELLPDDVETADASEAYRVVDGKPSDTPHHGGMRGVVASETDKFYMIRPFPGSKDLFQAPRDKTIVPEKVSGFAEVKGSVFPPKGPSAEDVKQTGLGDCYLQAALIAIVSTNPAYLRDMITEDDETVTVRLFKPPSESKDDIVETKAQAFEPRYLKVPKSRPVDKHGAFLYNVGAPWPAMVQKAWSVGGFAASGTGESGYEGTEGAQTGHALQVLLGGRPVRYEDPDLMTAQTTFETIQKALRGGRLVLAGTKKFKDTGQGAGFAGEKLRDGLAGTHAYAVLETKTEGSVNWVKLRNPWGRTGRGYKDGKPTKIDEGEFWIKCDDDFARDIDDIAIR